MCCMALPRILFVDDDSDVLAALSQALRKHRARWDMVFAMGGPAGLEEVRKAMFDVVISDMRMPEVDGASLLLAARDHDPTTFRMILSGYSDHSAVTRALPVAHQFFTKPCDLKLLASVVDRACVLRARFGAAPVQALIARLARLASPAEPIDPDPAASARLLRVAGSLLLGIEPAPSGPHGSAVALAELARTRIAQPTSGFSLDAHKLRAADIAERTHRAVAVPALAANAFTLGLVHGIGRALIGVGLPAEHAAIERATQAGARRQVVELEVLGVTCAELSAYALVLWGLPLDVVEAVASQDDEAATPSPLGLALRMALAA